MRYNVVNRNVYEHYHEDRQKKNKKTKNNPRELSYLNSSNIIQSTSRTRRNNTIIKVSAGQPDRVQPVQCNDLNCNHTVVYGHHMIPTLWTSFLITLILTVKMENVLFAR